MSTSTVYDDVVANVYEEDLQDKEDPDIEREELEDTEDPDPSDLKPLNLPSTAPTVPIVKHRAQPKKRRHPDSTVAKEMSADEKSLAIRRQVEYYFSDKNLGHDVFFHEKISRNLEGWLDASWILECNRMKELEVTSDIEIESALLSSDLETQWLFGEDSSGRSHKSLQVRRKLGKALPPLNPDSKRRSRGWLAKEIQQRRAEPTVVGQVPASVPVSATATVKVPEVGESVRLISGEHSGETGQVMAVDGEELTLLVGGADVVIASVHEVKKEW